MTTRDDWNELLEAAADVLSDALPVHGQPVTVQLSAAMERLYAAVEAIDPTESGSP